MDLVGKGTWPEYIKNKLKQVAKTSGVDILLETPKTKADLPNGAFERKKFWKNWANQGTYTILVVSNWLGNDEKIQLRKEALEANIALQFMLPMPRVEQYRAKNIILGLLVKAKWQPVGLEPLKHEKAAELVIGFDAGTNRNLYYGTSAFAILANGQTLGWELPEAQPGETISGEAILRVVMNLVIRFQRLEERYPRRILILRDGFVQANEFEATVKALQEEDIAVDILSVRKSGAGRIAVQHNNNYKDAPPGTAVLSQDNKTFLLITSEARAGGSARPLKCVRDSGDAPLDVLAKQVYRLSLLHPASAFSSSRLPMVLHFADKMAKEIQRLGQIAILQGVDREKIFFA